MTLRFDNYNRLIRWGAGVTAAGLLIFSSGIAASNADQGVVAPEDATILWVDVEDGGLNADQITGEIVAGDVIQSLEFHASPAGLTAALKDFPKEFGLRLSASEKTSARVAITFATDQENILSETNSIVELPLFEEEDDDNSTPEAKPTPNEPDPDGLEDNDNSTPEAKPTPDESDPNGSKDNDDKPSTDPVPTESESSSSGPGTNSPDNDDDETKPSPQAGSGDRNKETTAVTGAAVGWAVGSAAVLLVAGIWLLAVRKRGAHRNG